ncbi:MAG TPA: hypothetical protein VEW45_03195, partial [Candidatus Dormibacteraeota bacterium]|nr:hypothetical protein [Candidatus Dormibacteraeota bacterium]
MRRHFAVALSIVTLLLLAACGGTAPSPSPEQANPTTTPSPDPTVAPTATADGGLAECSSGDMPNLDSGWKFLQGGDATFGL